MNTLFAVLATGLLAAGPGSLTVDDRAKAFTADGVRRAAGLLEAARLPADAHLFVLTAADAAVPAAFKDRFDAAKGKQDAEGGLAVLGEWLGEESLKVGKKGLAVLVYAEGKAVLVRVKADPTSEAAGRLTAADTRTLVGQLVADFKAGNRDLALYQAVGFVVDKLKTAPPAAAESNPAPAAADNKPAAKAADGGYNVGGIICVALVAMLGLWLVFGLVRAFTRPHTPPPGYGQGAYGQPGGYGPGGYGGGGGGFMSGLMGGLFGAVAGNYLYNSFLGGSSLGATDLGGATGAEGGLADAGAGDGNYGGDYGGGTDAGGGDFGGGYGDAGGGDFGGGYGDAGGGDFGGGDGDFGGGGGDW
jgi:uncharacterized protein